MEENHPKKLNGILKYELDEVFGGGFRTVCCIVLVVVLVVVVVVEVYLWEGKKSKRKRYKNHKNSNNY